ncbi:MAG: hypothetical protein V8S34_02445 [Lawsonibacter sp.]
MKSTEITAQNLTIDTESGTPLTTRQKLTLVVFIIGLALTVWGIVNLGFGIDELSGIFLAIGIIGGLVGGLRPSKMYDHFSKRAARQYAVPLPDDRSGQLRGHPASGGQHYGRHHPLPVQPAERAAPHSGCLPSPGQDLFNVLVPSGCRSAAITMPIMAPLADMLGITGQEPLSWPSSWATPSPT